MSSKIYIDGFSLTGKELFGIHRYTYELLLELDKLIDKDSVILLVPNDSDKDFGFNNIAVSRVDLDVSTKLGRKKWNYFGFQRYVKKRGGISLDMTLGLPFTGCDIAAVYDCILERVKENSNTKFKKLTRLLYMLKVRINLRRAKAVITISEYSKKDITDIYKAPRKKIAIIYTAWQHFDRIVPDCTVLERLGLEKGSYCFSLGSRMYHKNFRWVAEAARQNPQYTFVVTGSDLISTSDAYLNDTKPDNMIFTGYLSDGEIKALMANCKVFIQPSLYEGAGMPPMEAMSTGARCIVSNRTSLPELYGNSVWYIDPEKYEGIDIDEIMSGEIADNKEVLDRFSWKKGAGRLNAVLNDVRRRVSRQEAERYK
ncbi:Glycosyltransferase involved in cell wall bisynthesis [Ruminococcaceae bacterium FB2012]|nr:Glycosyltransferase involved in cell wall bisynthesis [Ruminococcaceae bacterium FB2012]